MTTLTLYTAEICPMGIRNGERIYRRELQPQRVITSS